MLAQPSALSVLLPRGEVHRGLPLRCTGPGRDGPGEGHGGGGHPEEPGGLVEDQVLPLKGGKNLCHPDDIV